MSSGPKTAKGKAKAGPKPTKTAAAGGAGGASKKAAAGGAAKKAAGSAPKKTGAAAGGSKKTSSSSSSANKSKATSQGKRTQASKSKQAGSRKPAAKRGKDKIQKKPREFSSFMFRFRTPSRKIGRGGVMPKTKALGRLVRWPKYVQLQRQRKVLYQRLRIPPALNIFNAPAGRQRFRSMLQLLYKYKPEDRRTKQDRLRSQAKVQADQKPLETTKPIVVKFGFNHVTDLIEAGRAKLVLIASDVDPIELVLWMPTLCVKKDIPFAIVRGKSRLGTLVNRKTASCVALCDVKPEDEKAFKEIAEDCHTQYNKRFNYLKRKVAPRVLGIKTRHKIAKRRRFREAEAKKRKEAQEGEKAE